MNIGWEITTTYIRPQFELFLHICRYAFCPLPLDCNEFNFEDWQDYEKIARYARRNIFNKLMISDNTQNIDITEANWNIIKHRININNDLTNEDIVFIYHMLDQPSSYLHQWWHPNNKLPYTEQTEDDF
jgi:hypothetical protein